MGEQVAAGLLYKKFYSEQCGFKTLHTMRTGDIQQGNDDSVAFWGKNSKGNWGFI